MPGRPPAQRARSEAVPAVRERSSTRLADGGDYRRGAWPACRGHSGATGVEPGNGNRPNAELGEREQEPERRLTVRWCNL
jgi:hypothetical protein